VSAVESIYVTPQVFRTGSIVISRPPTDRGRLLTPNPPELEGDPDLPEIDLRFTEEDSLVDTGVADPGDVLDDMF